MIKKLLSIIILVSVQLDAVNLRLLKGTMEQLTPGLKKYAPVHGVPFSEGVAENYYNIGLKYIKMHVAQQIAEGGKSVEENLDSKKQVEDFMAQMQGSATDRLVGEMFHRSGGSFQLTGADNNPIRQLGPKHIGEIIRLFNDYDLAKGSAQEKVKYIFEKYGEKVSSQKNVPKSLDEFLKMYLADLGFQKASGSKFKAKDFKPFVDALIGSLQECNPASAIALYASGTTEAILIGYALRRCNTKKDLESYLEGLMDKKVALSDEQFLDEDIRRILAEGPQFDNPKLFGDWLTCAFYKKNYQSSLPKVTEAAHFSYDGVRFADCVETTIRNLCNIATYDGSKLGVIREGTKFSKELQKFYARERSQLPSEIANASVHQSWVDVIEDIPGIAYNNLKVDGQKDSLHVPADYAGFMPVDDQMISEQELARFPKKTVHIGDKSFDLHEKVVGGAKYLLVPQNSQLRCYEVMPTASNMLVALNTLFNLGLYQPKDIFTPQFADKYFESLCEKFGWDLRSYGAIDNTRSNTIDICKGDSCFAINLHEKAHGYVSVTESSVGSLVAKELLAEAISKGGLEKASEMMPLIDASISMQDVFDMVGKDSKKFMKLLRNLDVRNADRCTDVIKQIIELRLEDINLDEYVSKLIMQLPIMDDLHYHRAIAMDCRDFSLSVKLKRTLETFLNIALIKQGKVSSELLDLVGILAEAKIITGKEALSFIEKGMVSESEGAPRQAFDMFNSLVSADLITFQDKEQLFSCIEQSMKGIVSGEGDTRGNEYRNRLVFDIVQLLIKSNAITGQDKDKVLSYVEKNMASQDSYQQRLALAIIKELAEARIVTSQVALSYIEKGLASEDENVQRISLVLLQELVKSTIITGEYKGKLLSYVEKGMASEDINVQNSALDVIRALVAEGILQESDGLRLYQKARGALKEDIGQMLQEKIFKQPKKVKRINQMQDSTIAHSTRYAFKKFMNPQLLIDPETGIQIGADEKEDKPKPMLFRKPKTSMLFPERSLRHLLQQDDHNELLSHVTFVHEDPSYQEHVDMHY